MTKRWKYQQNKAVLALLAERWPACFAIYEARRSPLKVGIHRDILAALDGTVTAKKLSAALRCYTGNAVYRSRLRAGAVRIDLDGRPAGEVTADEIGEAKPAPRPASAKEPACQFAEIGKPTGIDPAATAAPERASRPDSRMPAPGGRLGLSDLRAAARRRREAEA